MGGSEQITGAHSSASTRCFYCAEALIDYFRLEWGPGTEPLQFGCVEAHDDVKVVVTPVHRQPVLGRHALGLLGGDDDPDATTQD